MVSAGSSNAGNVSPTPASFLLASEAHVAFNSNRTTARAEKLWGDCTVEVTFWIADPPNVSYYTLDCKTRVGDADLDDLPAVGVHADVPPRVVGAEGRFVLVRVLFSCDCEYEYFMYKGHPESPSLENVPLPEDCSLRGVEEFAIVPRGRGDDGHYLLIALCEDDEKDDYWLHIYSSEDATWRTKELPNPCPGVDTIAPDKVFVLRDGLLLWVDLLGGMLVCDVLQEPHHAQYIPLPEPLLGNREKKFQRGRRFRDLTCVDGLIKFIEMEHREIVREITVTDGVPPEKPTDPRSKNVLYDSDLIKLMKHKPVKPEIRIERSEDGWSAMTWTREIGSNCWRKGRIVDVDDILVDDSVFSELLSSQRSEPESAGNLTFKKLHSSWPTLSTDGNDILYLKSYKSGRGALVAVDLAEKTLKVEAPAGAHPFGIYFYVSPWQILRPYSLADHLKKTPGIEVSESKIARIGSSANKTAIRVGERDSYESDNKRPRHH